MALNASRLAKRYSESSGLKDASAVILAAEGLLKGVVINTDGTNSATLIVYDNASAASGTELFKAVIAGASNVAVYTQLEVHASSGIYASVSGTGAKYIIHYL